METKKVSPANYTPELIEEIKAGYDPKASESERTMQLQTLQESTGKSVQSLRMKLTQLGLYVKLETKKAVKKDKKPTRSELQSKLEAVMDKAPDTLIGVERANAGSIQAIIDFIGELKTQVQA